MEAPFEGCTILVRKDNLFLYIYINQLMVLIFEYQFPSLKGLKFCFEGHHSHLRDLKQVFNPFEVNKYLSILTSLGMECVSKSASLF